MNTGQRGANRRPYSPRKPRCCTGSPIPPTRSRSGWPAWSRRTPRWSPLGTPNTRPGAPLGSRVFVRTHGTGPGEQVIIVQAGASGPVEVARHERARPGSPAINDEHFPGTRTRIPGDYEVRARSADEAAFLAIGDGARTWLVEATAAGTARMNVNVMMAEAVTLAKNRRQRSGGPGPGRRRPAWPFRAPRISFRS